MAFRLLHSPRLIACPVSFETRGIAELTQIPKDEIINRCMACPYGESISFQGNRYTFSYTPDPPPLGSPQNQPPREWSDEHW